MNKPNRIQRSRQHKQVSPNGLEIQYVGRGSKWGNPFRIVSLHGKFAIKCSGEAKEVEILTANCHAIYHDKESASVDSVKCYALLIRDQPLFDQVKELRGKNLSCWCGLANTCHADLLLKLANAGAYQVVGSAELVTI